MARTRREALERALAVLAEAPDFSFAVAYLIDAAGRAARVFQAHGREYQNELGADSLAIPQKHEAVKHTTLDGFVLLGGRAGNDP